MKGIEGEAHLRSFEMANPEEVGGEELEPPKEDPCTRPVGVGNGENRLENV